VAVRRVLHVLAALGLLGLTPTLAACHTVAGIGQDLQAAGRAITGSSERTQQENTSAAQTPAPSPPPSNP
jgi:predicted small secreted protein